MEYGADKKASSEKDSRMASSFESYSDIEKPVEKLSKKKKKRGAVSVERVENIPDKQESSHETVAEKDDQTEKQHDLAALFESKDDTEPTDNLETIDINAEGQEVEPELPQNPEEISDSELPIIAGRIIDARGAELAEEHDDSPEQAAALSYLDSLKKKLGSGEQVDEALLDKVVDEVSTELDIQSVEIDSALEQSVPEETIAEHAEHDVFVTDTDETEPDEHPTTVAASSPVPLTRPPNNRTVRTGSGGLLPAAGALFGAATPSPEAPTPTAPSEKRYQRGADMLVGGIVGYLVGRRRGRITTEERLMPVQKSLEKKVKDLNEKISIREEKVRALTSEKIAREGEHARIAITQKVEAKARTKQEVREKAAEQKQASRNESEPKPAEQANMVMEAEPKTPKTESVSASEITSPTRRPERLASVVLGVPEIASNRTAETTNPVAKEAAREIVQKMPESELLVVAAKVEVDGQNAKQLYEQGRVSKEDLRQIVVEHVRGGRAERMLVERLRPVTSAETMERMPKEAGAGARQATGVGGASSISVNIASMRGGERQSIDISAASDALIAQQAAKDHRPESHATGWVVLAVVAAALVVAFFLF